MRKIKRFTVGLLLAVTACLMAVGLTGCTQKGDREKQEVHVCQWEIQSETKATCTSDARVKMVCKDADCGKTQTVTVPNTRLEHKYEADDVLTVPATCTQNAYIKERSCVICGGAQKAREEIPNTKLYHDGDMNKDNNLTADDLKNGKFDFKDKASREPNCQEKAYCGVCGEFYGDKLNHSPELVVYKELKPTCTTIGHIEYVECKATSELTQAKCTYTTYAEIAALGHNKVFDKSAVDYCGSAAATCTKAAYCGVCKQSYGEFGHNAKATGSKAATCLEPAYCGACESYYGESLGGHTYEVCEAVAQTCDKEGWAEYVYCTRCKYNTQKILPALGHDWKVIPAKAATCTEIGLTEGEHCARCRIIKIEPTAIEALGHDGQREDPGKGIFVSDKSNLPDCTRRGYCGICKQAYGETSETGMHDVVKVNPKEPTCTEPGWYEYVKCKYCDYNTFEQNARKPLNHKYVSYDDKEPTCTEDGHKAQTICVNCQKLEVIPAKGHDTVFDPKDKNYIGSTKGNCLVQSYCGVCHEHYGETFGHHEVGTPPTCTEDGICRVCQEAYIDSLGHYFNPSNGVCARCGKHKDECID